MANETELIIQLPRDSSIDENLRTDPPASLADGRIVVEHLVPESGSQLPPPRAGEIIYTVSSPEALRRDADEIRQAVVAAAADGGPLVVLMEGAEYLRDNELESLLDAAAQTERLVIVRVLAGV